MFLLLCYTGDCCMESRKNQINWLETIYVSRIFCGSQICIGFLLEKKKKKKKKKHILKERKKE